MALDITPTFERLEAQRNAYGHNNVCCVIAIAVVADASYDDALAAIQLAMEPYPFSASNNRTPWPRGFCGYAPWAAIRKAVYILTGQRAARRDDYCCRTLRQFENSQPDGAWILHTRGHAVGYNHGQIHDYTREHGRRRIIDAWKLTE